MYWIFKDGRYQEANKKANIAKQIISIAPDKKDKVIELVKKNNTNFTRHQDIIDLYRNYEGQSF